MRELNKRTGGGGGQRVVRLEELAVKMWGGPRGVYLQSMTLPDGLLWKDVELAYICCSTSNLPSQALRSIGETLAGLGDGGWGIYGASVASFSGSVLSLRENGFYKPVGFLAVMKE